MAVLESRQKGHSNVCIRCHNAEETIPHVYQCQGRIAKAGFREALSLFKKKLIKMRTAAPLIKMFCEFLVAYHQNRKPKRPIYSFGNKFAHTLLQRAYDHQMLLDSNVFHLGYLSYKWSIVHRHYDNKNTNKKNMSALNSPWTASIIHLIWNFSHSVWTKRCAHVHKKDKQADESLCSEELKSSIRSYLRLPRNELSSEEKILHLNVSRHLRRAFTTTLTRWLHLLASERERTIRSKRQHRIRNGGLQPITRFFRKEVSHN